MIFVYFFFSVIFFFGQIIGRTLSHLSRRLLHHCNDRCDLQVLGTRTTYMLDEHHVSFYTKKSFCHVNLCDAT